MSCEFSSCVTFLYFDDFSGAKQFFTSVLGLEQVLDQNWAAIWRVGESGFLGAVDAEKGSIPVTSKDGVLVSFNVQNVELWRRKMAGAPVTGLTPIKHNAEIGLKSFFFQGPEGYNFEIQEFTQKEQREIF